MSSDVKNCYLSEAKEVAQDLIAQSAAIKTSDTKKQVPNS